MSTIVALIITIAITGQSYLSYKNWRKELKEEYGHDELGSQGDRKKGWNVFKTILKNTSKTEREGNQKWNPFSSRLKYGTIRVTGVDKVKMLKVNNQ